MDTALFRLKLRCAATHQRVSPFFSFYTFLIPPPPLPLLLLHLPLLLFLGLAQAQLSFVLLFLGLAQAQLRFVLCLVQAQDLPPAVGLALVGLCLAQAQVE